MRFLLFLLSILLIGCSQTEQRIYSEFGKPIEVYFCPQDNCDQKLIGFINSSEKSIHCAFFDLDLEEVENKLEEKSKELDVKLVVDRDNLKKLNIINFTWIKSDNNKQLTHNKFCIKDKTEIFTGSFNPTTNGKSYNNNNILIINSRYLAENYEEEFNELWNNQFGEGKKTKNTDIIFNNIGIENYFCPEDSCEIRIANEISKAKHSINFMIFTFTSEPIADAILFTQDVTIKGIIEKRQANIQGSQYERLKDFGLNISLDNNSKSMHHKVFILDNETVITGSFNPTKAANERNDENILIIRNKEIADKYLEEFDRLFLTEISG